ncbi:hypothetical protein [Saccharothrix stipae]
MTGVAVVFGMCALSFAAGCVLTAVMLRRDQPPEPAPRPAAPVSPAPVFEPQFPPEDYVTRPIHRNPVVGVPVALPAPEPARPNLVLVTDARPGAAKPVRLDEVRRMHVVRAGDVPQLETEPPGPAVPPGPTAPEPAGSTDAAEPADPVEIAEPAAGTAESETETAEPAEIVESGTEIVEPVDAAGDGTESVADTVVIQVPAQAEPVLGR